MAKVTHRRMELTMVVSVLTTMLHHVVAYMCMCMHMCMWLK